MIEFALHYKKNTFEDFNLNFCLKINKQLLNYKSNTSLCGCSVNFDQNNFTINSSDNKVVASLYCEDYVERAGWTDAIRQGNKYFRIFFFLKHFN